MNQTLPALRRVCVALVPVLFAGCASVAVTSDILERRTADALGLQPGTFVISEREDEGTTTRYTVQTRQGQRYRCFVGGSFNVLGRSVSEAVCNRPGETPRNPLLGR